MPWASTRSVSPRRSSRVRAATSSPPPIMRRCTRRWAGQALPMPASRASRARPRSMDCGSGSTLRSIRSRSMPRSASREEQWFAPGRWRRATQPVADAASPGCRLCPAGPDRGRRGHGRMVAGPARTAGSGGDRRVPLPGPRPRAGVALAADHRRFEAGAMPLPGMDAGCRTLRVAATGRGRLRPRVFVARMVGWACELARGGGRVVAAHRAGDGIARGFVRRTARGAAGSGQRCCRRLSPRATAGRCHRERRVRADGLRVCRSPSVRRRAGRPGRFSACPRRGAGRSDSGCRGGQRAGRSRRGIPGRWRNAAAHRCSRTPSRHCCGPMRRTRATRHAR